jgi:hypothetical protein
MAMIGRRAALTLPALLLAHPARAQAPAFLSAAADAAGRWRAAAFGLDGTGRFELALPARGHGAAVVPGAAVLFARRPGRFALVLDPASGAVRQRIEPATERWFCGHGTFSADGALLHATEIDADGQGLVGVYATGQGYRRIGEFPTGGLDSHDIRLARDGTTLVVANGGIRTDPRLPRARFELDGMDSSLAWIDAASGQILARRRLPEAQALLSLRHLAIGSGGMVFVAAQHEGPRFETLPLVAVAHGEGLATLHDTSAVWRGMDHYAGSAAASADGRLVAVTSPRGGMAAVFDTASGAVRARVSLPDGCGVAAAPEGGFVMTSGLGEVAISAGDAALAPLPGAWLRRLRWDNHLVALAG